MRYRILYKRWSITANSLVLVEDVIEADHYDVEQGVLTFWKEDAARDGGYRPFMSLPPTYWIIVEPADIAIVEQPKQPSIVVP